VIAEVVELGREPLRWRTHLLERLLPMIDARVGIAGEHFMNPDHPAQTRIVGLADAGWGEADWRALCPSGRHRVGKPLSSVTENDSS
jgi:hypothetical protein